MNRAELRAAIASSPESIISLDVADLVALLDALDRAESLAKKWGSQHDFDNDFPSGKRAGLRMAARQLRKAIGGVS